MFILLTSFILSIELFFKSNESILKSSIYELYIYPIILLALTEVILLSFIELSSIFYPYNELSSILLPFIEFTTKLELFTFPAIFNVVFKIF